MHVINKIIEFMLRQPEYKSHLISDHPFSDVLKQIKLPLMDHDKCEGTFINRTRLGDPDQPKFKLHKSFICAGGKHGEDTCRGDGGGPLMCPTTRTPNTNDDYVQVS